MIVGTSNTAYFFAACLWTQLSLGTSSAVDSLNSPDGKIRVSITLPGSGATEKPRWSAEFSTKPVLRDCGLGLQTSEAGELVEGAKVIKTSKRSENERISVLFGKSDHAQNQFSELRYKLESRQHQRFDLVFRCYNDAIALRYELPAQSGLESITISNETTSFEFLGQPTAFVQYLENYTTSHEHTVSVTNYVDIRRDTLLDLPLTLSWKDGTYAAVTEAALRRYAGMGLVRGAGNTLVSDLTPRPHGTRVVARLPLQTPWRVVLIADRPGALLESRTIYCLNEPSQIKDVSWIHPGKITFPWWNGDVYDGKRGLPILSVEMAKKYIDFCARNGIPAHSMTSTEDTVTPWYQQSKPGTEPGPDTDVTRPREGFESPTIRDYAKSKGVRLWTWVHQGALRGRVEEAFAAFEKLGWCGMMVDFFDHDDQESVEFAESILQAAARHHILIHFHGVWKPTGWERTYPNLMNHEGALNLEYLKWSDLCPPEHSLMMAFTRLIAGPMDYHLGGFRAVPRDQFKPSNIAPTVLGTRCHMLGLYVCFNNPMPMVADYPLAYEGQAGWDFVKEVPTWWDETRVLSAEIGEFLVVARRKGTTWYLGGISARRACDLAIPLSTLGTGRYKCTLWKDVSEARPNELSLETLEVSNTDKLKVHLALDGGFVARLTTAGGN